MPTIAQELKVDALVAGSVVQLNDRVRVTAQLISGSTAGSSGRRRSIVRCAICRPFSAMLPGDHGTCRRMIVPADEGAFDGARAIDPKVHRQFLLGRHHLGKATEESLHRAVQHFEAAIASDRPTPRPTLGWPRHIPSWLGSTCRRAAVMPKAKSAAEAALRLDDTLADAHAALGYVHLVYDWDGPAAEKSLLRALDLNPTLAAARLNYAAYLSTQARFDETIREVKRALDLDPRSIRTHASGTTLLIFTRRYDEAIELARKGLEFEPGSAFILAFQGVAFAELRRFEEAVANVRKAISLDNSLTIRALQAHVLAVAGLKEEAATVFRQMQEAARPVFLPVRDCDRPRKPWQHGHSVPALP